VQTSKRYGKQLSTTADRPSSDQDALRQRARIREVIENFVVWFDAGDFARFRTVWHVDGVMNTTRGKLSAVEFAANAERNWLSGASVGCHFLGGSSIDIVARRAIAQTKVTLNSRLSVEGISCDAVCIARFYDFFECRGERWAIVERQPIYERDRLDPVEKSAGLKLDAEQLARYPEGYRHLAYAQTKNGLSIRTDLPGLRGEAVEALYARGAAWLAAEKSRLESEQRL
jgi:hypothetical protein